jgi:hypothetical protein
VSLSDVAGVFSRYFILGYFLPVFFALIALWQLLTGEFIPNAFDEKYDGAVAVAILAGAALPLGLVLLGLAYPILRIMEGYFLIKPYASSWTYYPLWWLSRLLLWRQRAAFDTWTRQRHQRKDSGLRILSAWRLDVYFPPERQDLLPTRFGNAVRAFELHSWKRYRLDSIGAWPRVELLLSEQERELLEDAQTGVAFFINSSVAALFTGILLAVDWAVFRSFGEVESKPRLVGETRSGHAWTCTASTCTRRSGCACLQRMKRSRRLRGRSIVSSCTGARSTTDSEAPKAHWLRPHRTSRFTLERILHASSRQEGGVACRCFSWPSYSRR